MAKELARDIIGIIIVIGAVLSLFLSVSAFGADLLRFLAGAVIGFYFGGSMMPFKYAKAAKRNPPVQPSQ